MKVLNFDNNSIIHALLQLYSIKKLLIWEIKQYNACNVVIISFRFYKNENHSLVLSPQFSTQ